MFVLIHQTNAVTFYDQLYSFNYNWNKYKDFIDNVKAQTFKSDKEYIQAHLQHALSVLKSNPVHQFSSLQFVTRLRFIELLENYCNEGNFPVNYHCMERTPVFIDERKTHCAVGYLMEKSGYEEMAQRIAANSNYAWLKDIHDKEFPAWQQSSGLTVEELMLIQGAYDFYIPDAFIAPNKYEIPQKPSVILAYFENKLSRKSIEAKKENIWIKGEGVNGVLNGKWEQNYAIGVPWIVGYYENGKRSGQWQEYYQGTNKLCRTENWRNDKLNGVRRRFSTEGALIEEILFADGSAVTKTNYDLENSLTWIRKPLDSSLVYTQVFTTGGALIARGRERIYNPGNLLWFQNIELTALNSISVISREISLSDGNASHQGSRFGRPALYNAIPLVEYKKEGDWMYFKEYINPEEYASSISINSAKRIISKTYPHFGSELVQSIQLFTDPKVNTGYDSIQVSYKNNMLQDFYAYGTADYLHLYICYKELKSAQENPEFFPIPISSFHTTDPTPQIKMIGQYNKEHKKIGTWKYYNRNNTVYKTENFLVAWKEDEEENY